MQTLLISDTHELFEFLPKNIQKISALEYLSNSAFANGKPYRIINLCKSYQYQSTGYYVSLLAEARRHKVLPSVMTIQDITKISLSTLISENIEDEIQNCLSPLKSTDFVLSIYFGKNIAKRYDSLARKLHSLFPLPLFRVYFKYSTTWKITKIRPITIVNISESHYDFLQDVAQNYFNKKRFHNYRQKNRFYDLAILHNPNEITAPSNKKALEKFIQAGESLDIYIELVDKSSFKFLAEYDGLFIRETTAVNHYTYDFSRKASSERMTVIDDPLSILRCSNKVYLAELMQKNRIATPKTWILSKLAWRNDAKKLSFPCVLKLPDSSFSKGVVKIEEPSELETHIKQFFKLSDLIIAQEFFYTDFDWRIGIIDNKPLFACRYYMANGHWQIYNWQDSHEKEGMFESLPIVEVPSIVLKSALKISKLIGNSFYGVDIKQRGNKAYIIEVNDNPNVDHGVEDSLLGDELYYQIMNVFLTRMRRQHGYEQ